MAGGGGGGAETYTTDEALTLAGFGRFQALLLAFLGAGWVAEAMQVMLLSFLGPPVAAEWGVSGSQEGLVTGVLFAGMLLGSFLGGLASDRYGRRVGFLLAALVTGVFGLLSALSPSYASLLALRFAVGLGLGADHVLPTWFLEFVPAASRGSWMSAFNCCWTLGTILQALLAWVLMPVLGWRWLVALSSSPCFVLLAFFGLSPESPRYLCSRGRTTEAALILERIARMNNSALPPGILTSHPKIGAADASETTPLVVREDGGIDEDKSSKFSGMISAFRALFSRDLTRSTLLLCFVYFAIHIGYYGIVLLTSKVSNGGKMCPTVGAHLKQSNDSSLYIDVLVTSFAEFPGLLLAALVVDRVGRRVSMGGMLLMCCAFVAPLAAHLGEGSETALLSCARACIIGSLTVLRVYGPEVYPTPCRNTGVGVANCLGRLGSMVAPVVIATLLESCRQKEAVFVLGMSLFLAGAACALFPLETKGRQIE